MDQDELRDGLMDYFGSATPFYPAAFMEVINIENASSEQLEQIDKDNGNIVSDQIKRKRKRF